MSRCRQDSNLLNKNQGTTTNSQEDLAHAHVSDVEAGLAEVDHQAAGQKVERDSPHEQPLEAAGDADQVSAADQPDGVHEVEDSSDVSGLGEAGVVDYLQEGGEVAGPAVVGDLVGNIQEAGTDDGAVGDKVVGDEGLGGTPAFVGDETDEDEEADDHHCDDLGGFPFAFGVAGDVERGEEEDKSADHEEDADDWMGGAC